MISEIMIAALAGVAKSLGERLVRGPEPAASIRSVVADVKEIRQLQTQGRATMVELKRQLALVLERTDGLEVRRRSVVFEATEKTPNVQSAMMNLDLEISRLRAAAVSQTHGSNPAAVARAADPSSIFYQLDEEIADRRADGQGAR